MTAPTPTAPETKGTTMTMYQSPSLFYDALALEQLDNELHDATLSEGARRLTTELQEDAQVVSDNRAVFADRLRDLEQLDLTDHQRQRQRDQLLRDWSARLEGELSGIERRAQNALTSAEARIRLAPLDTARQSAAEGHITMLLGDTPLGQIPDRLAELAASDSYPDVAHVLVSTPFGRMVLDARGARGQAGNEWEERRLQLLRPRLNAAGQTALDDLPGLRAAAKIPQYLRGIYDDDRRRYGLR